MDNMESERDGNTENNRQLNYKLYAQQVDEDYHNENNNIESERDMDKAPEEVHFQQFDLNSQELLDSEGMNELMEQQNGQPIINHLDETIMSIGEQDMDMPSFPSFDSGPITVNFDHVSLESGFLNSLVCSEVLPAQRIPYEENLFTCDDLLLERNSDVIPSGIDCTRLETSETICFENYPGEYRFKVVPAPNAQAKKFVYSAPHNKLYCDIGTYEFFINMEFDFMNNLDGFTMRTVLAFTDPVHRDRPVTMCLYCHESQKREHGDQDFTYHVVRAPTEDKSVSYCLSKDTGRYYLTTNLRAPELGASHLSQSLHFQCRSSCKSDLQRGMNRRPTNLIFTLFDSEKQIVGRSVLKLRICSAPLRDFNNEFGEKAEVKKKAKKRKTYVMDEAEKSRLFLHQEEYETASETKKMAAYERELMSMPPVPHCPEPETPKVFITLADIKKTDARETSSQETTYSDEDSQTAPRLKMNKLMRNCKAILTWRHGDDVRKKDVAVHCLRSLTFVQRIVDSAVKNFGTEPYIQPQ